MQHRCSNFLLLIAVAVALSFAVVSCGRVKYVDIPVAQLKQMPAFRATVERKQIEEFKTAEFGTVALVGLRTEDGKRISIGGEKATAEIIGFVSSLESGKTYTFPDVFLEFLKSHPQIVRTNN